MTDQDQPDQDQLERAFEYYPRLKKVKKYVEEHLDEPITLEDVAQVVSLEPKYFSAWFKTRTGQTFSVWLQRSRVQEAKRLLDNQDLPIVELALKVGYSHPRGFQRAFKKWVGSTATEYKNQSFP